MPLLFCLLYFVSFIFLFSLISGDTETLEANCWRSIVFWGSVRRCVIPAQHRNDLDSVLCHFARDIYIIFFFRISHGIEDEEVWTRMPRSHWLDEFTVHFELEISFLNRAFDDARTLTQPVKYKKNCSSIYQICIPFCLNANHVAVNALSDPIAAKKKTKWRKGWHWYWLLKFVLESNQFLHRQTIYFESITINTAAQLDWTPSDPNLRRISIYINEFSQYINFFNEPQNFPFASSNKYQNKLKIND